MKIIIDRKDLVLDNAYGGNGGLEIEVPGFKTNPEGGGQVFIEYYKDNLSLFIKSDEGLPFFMSFIKLFPEAIKSFKNEKELRKTWRNMKMQLKISMGLDIGKEKPDEWIYMNGTVAMGVAMIAIMVGLKLLGMGWLG